MAKGDKEDTGNGGNDGFEGVGSSEGEGFTFDMSNQEEDSGFPVAPPGVYDASVDSLTYGTSKSSGNPMWTVSLLVLGGDSDPAGEVAKKNIKVRFYLVMKPDQMGRVKRFLNCFGASEQANDAQFNPAAIAASKELVGKTGRVRLKIEKSEEYGDRNSVAAVLPPKGAGEGDGGFQL